MFPQGVFGGVPPAVRLKRGFLGGSMASAYGGSESPERDGGILSKTEMGWSRPNDDPVTPSTHGGRAENEKRPKVFEAKGRS